TVHPGIDNIQIWNRSPARRDALIETLGADRPVEAADNLAEAVAWADIICCATMTTDPLIRGEWLDQGTHLDLVGAFRTDMREADDETLRQGRLFVDSRQTTIGEIGELLIPMNAGVITKEDVLADLYQLCAGHPGRGNPTEITIYKNGGGGHLDLMTATHIRERCTSLCIRRVILLPGIQYPPEKRCPGQRQQRPERKFNADHKTIPGALLSRAAGQE
ncbi:MAG TPA: hypothetical protein QF597_07980, partial [Arenicellales bacterium]|nr:hypothetical protein [Arenicellales bacterium]